MRIFLLNGPPRSGKDTIARNMEVPNLKFAGPLKDAVHKAFDLDVPADFFERRKDIPCPEFYGKTPRQVYIAFSESFVKPLFGPDYFGKVMVGEMLPYKKHPFVVISDVGFAPEVARLIERFADCVLVRVHRKNTSFANDSRQYLKVADIMQHVTDPTVKAPRCADVYNDSETAPGEIAKFLLSRDL